MVYWGRPVMRMMLLWVTLWSREKRILSAAMEKPESATSGVRRSMSATMYVGNAMQGRQKCN